LKTSMKKKFRQALAMLFAVAMVFTSIPQTAYAAEANNVDAVEAVETTEEAVEIVEGEEFESVGETVSGNTIYYAVTTNVAEGATVAYVDGCVETVEGVDMIAEGTDLEFCVDVAEEVKEVKEVDDVVCTVSGNEIAVATNPTENGTAIYSVASEDIAGDVTITVTLKDKEAAAPEVEFYSVTFGNAEGASVNDVQVNGEEVEVTDGKLQTVSANTIVSFKVDTEESHKLNAVKAKVGEAEATEVVADEDVYSVTVTDNVEISIETEAYNKVTFAVAGDADSYTATVSGNEAPVYEIGDVYYTDEASVQFAFKAAAGYKIDKVEVNGKAQTENDAPKTAVELSFAEVKDYTVKVTTSPLASEADAKVVFANSSDYMTYAVTTNEKVKKAVGKNNTYDVFAGADYIRFTVTATGNYQPVAKMDGVDLTFEKGTAKKGKTPYTFKVRANALKAENIITIEHELEDKTVTVFLAEDEVIPVSSSIDGVAAMPDSASFVDGVVTMNFKVPYGSTLTMSVEANENCKITKAVTTIGTKTKNEKIKKNAVTFSVKATDDASVVINSEKLYSVCVIDCVAGEEIVPVKGVYNVEWLGNDMAARIGVRYGEGFFNLQTIKAVSLADAKNKNAEIGSTLTFIQESGNTVAGLTVSGNDAGKTLAAKVTIDDGSEEGKSFDLKFKVAPVAAKVTVKGVKNGVLTQAADTTKEYALTYNVKGVSDIYRAEMTSVSGNEVVGSAEIANGKLVVTTIPGVGEKVAKIRIYNSLTGETLTNGEFDLTIAAPAMMNIKPTVKLKSSDDVSLTLTLGAKKVDTPNIGKVYYKVEVTSAETDENIVNAIAKPFYYEKNGNSQDVNVVVNNSAFGFGKAAKYDVKVTLVQTKDGETLTAENAAEKDVFTSNKFVEKKKLATKAAYYETKLKLKKGKTTVYTGQSDIVVATAQFGKNTTHRFLDAENTKVVSAPFDYEELAVSVVNGTQIAVSVPNDLEPGKYTIETAAVAPENTVAAKATITINVVQGISDGTLGVGAPAKVYKQNNKAATVSAKVYYHNDAKTKKVTWTVLKPNRQPFGENDPLYGKISVKNGKVTIAKNYIVSDNEAQNQFIVRATAADWKGNNAYADSNVITITASTVSLGDVVIAKYNYETSNFDVIGRSGSTLTIDQISGAEVVVLEKGVVEKDSYTWEELDDFRVPTEDLTLKISNKAVELDSYSGYIGQVIKAVKNVKITATTTDGSKKKAVLNKLTINYPEVNDLCLEVSNTVSSNGLEIDYSAQANERVIMSLYDQRSEEKNYLYWAVNATVKVTEGGKLVYSDAKYNYYEFIPTAKETKIKVIDKSKTPAVEKTYVLTNVNWQDATAPAVTVSGNHLYAGKYPLPQTVRFAVDSSYAGKTVRVSADGVELNKNGKLEDFCWQLFGYEDDLITTVSEDGTFNLTWNVPYAEDWATWLDKGNYKLCFTFGHKDADTEEFVAETATTSTTVKVVKPNVTKSTFKPATSYKIFVKDGLDVKLTGTGKGVDMSSLHFSNLQNVNVKGQANKFTDYFVLDEDGCCIKLKDNVNVDDITANDLKGYVSYSVAGDHLLNTGCEGTVQIKITLEKKKTSQNYALSALTVSGNSASEDTVSANTISGNVFAYVNGDIENRADVREVYIDSEEFDGYSTLDGEVYLINKSELEYGSHTVTTYIVTNDNRYEFKIYLLKQEWVNAEEGEAKDAAYAAYQKAIKDHGVKVTTSVTIVK